MDAFSRTKMLLGEEAMQRLANARIAVFGIGGVGGFAVEALARSGIGALDLIDKDTVSSSNLNRQIIATYDTIGMAKTDAAQERIRQIHPACAVTARQEWYLPETADAFDLSGYDYIIDAIDTISGKLELAQRAYQCGTPIISAMGAGNKLDPTAFEVADIGETSVCPLARVMRRELKKRGVPRLKVVYSKELPIVPGIQKTTEQGKPIPGSVAFVPSVMGLILAGEVIKDLTGVKGAS